VTHYFTCIFISQSIFPLRSKVCFKIVQVILILTNIIEANDSRGLMWIGERVSKDEEREIQFE
jgi:hypothetical protein